MILENIDYFCKIEVIIIFLTVMRRLHFDRMYIAIMAFICMGFAACSSDSDNNNGGDLNTPKYESSSALYNITESGSDYSSIEFTASGNYLIMKKYATAKAPNRIATIGKTQFGFLGHAVGVTRTSNTYGNIIYGTYTKDGDTYILDGFGTIVVNGGGSSAVSLDITTTDGNKITLGAQREQQYSSSDMTNKLCRTWKLNQVKIEVTTDDQVVLSRTYNGWGDYLIGMAEDEGHPMSDAEKKEVLAEEPQQVIFTKSGTYVVFYANQTLGVSTWKWTNESKGEARYSWNYESINDSYDGGAFTVAFEGSQFILTESFEVTYKAKKSMMYLSYYMTEVR